MTTERMYEQAEILEQAIRDKGLHQAQQCLSGSGCDECVGCGEQILTVRRAALPSATHCIDCQILWENKPWAVK